MSEIRFAKYCSSGNDFIVIDNRRHRLPAPLAKFVKAVTRRKFSVGADGVLFLAKIDNKLRLRIFNPDGSEAEMCGNGARAFARFICQSGIAGRNISFQTRAGEISAKISGKSVKLKMTSPLDIRLRIPLRIRGQLYTGHFINTGVPHLVVAVRNLDKFPVKEIGRSIRFHRAFKPSGTNVDFISIESGKIFLRTYERGVEDETLACGTGAVASGIIAFILGRIKKAPVKIMARGGELKIYFKKVEGLFQDVYLEGEACFIYEGKLKEEAYV